MEHNTTDNRTIKRKIGDIGENIACEFLVKRGFKIIGKNYLKKWGEIDIIAEKQEVLHFVEVKSVTHATLRQAQGKTSDISDAYRPEENMHPGKLKRLSRVIQTYLLDKKIDKDWQLDLITVRIDMNKRIGRCEIIENVII
ncbi:MAG: YraN family protein [bacterium]